MGSLPGAAFGLLGGGTTTLRLGACAPGSDPTAAEFAMMDYMARMELKAKNPTLFAELRKALQAANRNY